MSNTATKVCTVCHKDVSSAKRVKDAKGHYFCAACYEAAQRQPVGAAMAGVAAQKAPPASKPADDGMDLVPLAEESHPKPRPSPQPAATATAEAPQKAKLPEFCPACGTKVLANRRICFKCNRDVTQLEKLTELRAKQAAQPTADTQFAVWFGRVMRVAMWTAIAGVVVFLLWGIKIMIFPGGLWDNYPKSREAVVREFLQDISTGIDKSYGKAFMLISFRERSTNNSGEEGNYIAVFRKMHDEFGQKYGSDWFSKIKLENMGAALNYADDEVDFRLTLGADSYMIATQVQIDTTKAVANMTLPRKKKPVYSEDGKNHFGILDIAEYRVHPTRRMVEMVGPGQPVDPEDMMPGVPIQQ